MGETVTIEAPFVIADESGTTVTESGVIEVIGRKEDPLPLALNITTDEDMAISGMLAATDIDSSSLTFTLLDEPVSG